MAVTSLATTDDVEAAFGRDLTSAESARAEAVLAKVSELFRRESGQQFTSGSSSVRLKVDGGMLYLPQRPVVSVTSVVDDDGEAVDYTQSGQWLTVDAASDVFLTVAYTHGGTVPDLVRLTVAEAVKTVLSIAEPATQGITQRSEADGSLSESTSYAAWAVGGQTMLSPADVALARSYHFRPPRAHVMVP